MLQNIITFMNIYRYQKVVRKKINYTNIDIRNTG